MKLVVDGATVVEHHQVMSTEWLEVIQSLGAKTVYHEGDFCQGGCGTYLHESRGNEMCESCSATVLKMEKE